MTASLNRRVRLAGIGAVALVTGFGGLAVLAAPASAAPTTRYVATDGSDGNGDNVINDCTVKASPCATIVHAVSEADAGDTIDIAKGEYQETVRIRKPLTLQGAGSAGSGKTVVDGDHDGGASIFVDGLDVGETTAVTVKDIAVDGNPTEDGIDIEGDATLHLIDSSSSHNGDSGVSSVQERLVAAKAALPTPTVTISGSDVSDNSSDGITLTGTPVHVDHSTVNRNGDGGLIFDSTTADVSTSTFDGNDGAGIVVDSPDATLTLDSSTVSNTAAFTGDRTPFGAGIILFGATATITNSTVAANDGAGVLNLAGQATVVTSTVTGTHAVGANFPDGGLVTVEEGPALRTQAVARVHFGGPTGTAKKAVAAPAISVVGSIVAEQDGKVADCAGTIVDNGYNLSSDAANSCKFSAAKHDQLKTDPLLGPLADNGGPTRTEILKKLSPAIDAVPAGQANCSTDAMDQRGVARPQPTGGKCDVGAVEVAAKPLVIHPNSLPNGKVGMAYHATVTATGGQYPVYTFSLAAGSLPDGLTMNSHGKIGGTPTQAGTFHFTVSVNDPVLKAYTIVISDDASGNGNGNEPISNTGVHTGSMLAVGGGAVLAGLLLLLYVGKLDRRARGPRIVYARHLKK